MELFGVSALYHRGNWGAGGARPPAAASTTPTSSCRSPAPTRPCAWPCSTARRGWWCSPSCGSAPLAGIVFRCAWMSAPAWVYTPFYMALGWVAVAVLPRAVAGGRRGGRAARHRRRARLHVRGRGVRPTPTRPDTACVRVPRGLPPVDDRRVRHALPGGRPGGRLRRRWRDPCGDVAGGRSEPGTPIYGLDIETDTTIDGLDPAVAAVVTVALSTPEGDEVLFGDEPTTSAACSWRSTSCWPALPPGRDRHVERRRVRPAVPRRPGGPAWAWSAGCACGSTRPSRCGAARSPATRAPTAGAGTGTGHLDAYRLYRNDLRRVLDVSCSLKSVARRGGAHPGARWTGRGSTTLGRGRAGGYVASDARLARILVERRWPGAARFVDAVTPAWLSQGRCRFRSTLGS